ncbi:MAG: UDP-4-amino-4,6-dideoxy-N-acetyl-beta-L-altrosamine N-acetyltransferase [Cytophagaceae bacterium]
MADIILKPILEVDIEMVRSWRNSPEVSKYMYTSDEITAEQQLQWFKRLQLSKDQKVWIVEYNGKKIGVASLYNMKENFKSAYWAFYLGETGIRGAGIGAKVEYNICKYVFEELNFNKLLCEVFIWNEAVIRMHEKFGFRRESYFREHILKDGKFTDVVGLALLKNEWIQIRDSLHKKIYGDK